MNIPLICSRPFGKMIANITIWSKKLWTKGIASIGQEVFAWGDV
jgi:hypothetical protein